MNLLELGADIVNRYWQPIASFFAVITAIQTSKVWSVLRFINSTTLSVWRFVAGKPRTFTGNWLAVYEPRGIDKPAGRQVEILKCVHTTGNELSGSIRNEDTSDRYSFGGRFVFDEVVGHYWSESVNRDIGTFKLQGKAGSADILSGALALYDSVTNKTREGMKYTWYRRQSWVMKY